MFQSLMGKVAKVLPPSKNKHQTLKQMMEEKELGNKIRNLHNEKEQAKEVHFEDNLDHDESMTKRKALSDGGSDAGGSKRSRSEKKWRKGIVRCPNEQTDSTQRETIWKRILWAIWWGNMGKR